MAADADLQVWLDTQANMGTTLLVPYVKSVTDRRISFRLNVIQRSDGGTSRIQQQGLVKAVAQVPISLGQVVLSARKNAGCRIELELKEGGTELGIYRFDCPH